MCGFAGEFITGAAASASADVVGAMAARLAHRGPDDAATWVSDDGRCAIGFRRLAVIDPPLSHQPMISSDGQAVVAFNGEIYNFRQLRTDLQAAGAAFRTHGDTEVLLETWRRYGEGMLDHLEGMFAFVIHDRRSGRLFMARDRLGQKPLWYAFTGDRIVFASEAKALRAHPAVCAEADPEAVALYLTMGYVPAPRSVWRDIAKLPPAHCMVVGGSDVAPRRYWRLPESTGQVAGADAVARVREVLAAATARRLVADVPIGALLSGGVDSSIVAALMCQATGDPHAVKTFTAGFAESEFDERPFAREVAEHLGTDHRELTVAATDAPTLLDELVGQYDEPFADSSALPTYLICRAAREHVTVALTGDGGDEVFGGYDRYRAMRLAERMGPGRWLLARLAGTVAGALAPHDERSRLRRMARFASALNEPPARQYFHYRRLFSQTQLEALLERDFAATANIDGPEQWFLDLYEQGDFDNEPAYAQQHDLLTYLPDDLLVKADIASMACSLELRSPMLAHEVASLGLALPVESKIRPRRGKAILHDAFADLLPATVFRRPKTGFGAPIDRWLRSELLEALRESVLDGPLTKAGWISYLPAERMIEDHLAGRADHRHRLWALLWLGRWLASQG